MIRIKALGSSTLVFYYSAITENSKAKIMTNNFPINISFRHKLLKQKVKEGQIICFHNCKLFRNGKFIHPSNEEMLWVRDGHVLDPFEIFYGEKQRAHVHVNCENLILVPGFLDIQLNGAFGVDFTTIAAETDLKIAEAQLKIVTKRLLEHGVTGFCPTLITTKPKRYRNFLKLLKCFNPDDGAAQIHGAHFEGPFLSEHQSGCHPKEDLIKELSKENTEFVYGNDLSNLSIVTLAPELNGAKEAISHLSKKNVKVSIGHSIANVEQAREAINCGASCVTHMFNAIQPFHHRNPGIVGLLTKNDCIDTKQLYYGIIADGIHLAESTIQLAIYSNQDGCILVTDAITALGLGDGVHQFGGRKIKVENNKATVDGTNTLAGSVTSMPKCMQFFASCISKSEGKDGLTEALKAATYNPAQFLGINKNKGMLTAGSDADFVLMDENFNIFATFIGGRKCYEAEN